MPKFVPRVVEEEVEKTPGEIIRWCRLQTNLSQETLAAAIHTTSGSISMWERGVVNPSAFHFLKVVEACGFDFTIEPRTTDGDS